MKKLILIGLIIISLLIINGCSQTKRMCDKADFTSLENSMWQMATFEEKLYLIKNWCWEDECKYCKECECETYLKNRLIVEWDLSRGYVEENLNKLR